MAQTGARVARHRAHGGAPVAARGRLLAWLLFVALAWQSLVVQTHVHLGHAPTRAGASASAELHAHHRPDDQAGDLCPLCAAGQQSDFALPASPAVGQALPATLAPDALPPLAGEVRAKSHAWRGRGPPAA